MTDKNREIMRDSYRLLDQYENISAGDERRWMAFYRETVAVCERWKNDPLMMALCTAIYGALSDKAHAAAQGEQLSMTM